jgi:hypothetical protein
MCYPAVNIHIAHSASSAAIERSDFGRRSWGFAGAASVAGELMVSRLLRPKLDFISAGHVDDEKEALRGIGKFVILRQPAVLNVDLILPRDLEVEMLTPPIVLSGDGTMRPAPGAKILNDTGDEKGAWSGNQVPCGSALAPGGGIRRCADDHGEFEGRSLPWMYGVQSRRIQLSSTNAQHRISTAAAGSMHPAVS